MTDQTGEEPAGDAAGASAAPEPLSDTTELLYRQVHPDFFDGEPTNGAFRPGSNDNGQLSVARGSLTTAEGAFRRHTQDHGRRSVGTWGLTVGEAKEAELNTMPDPLPDDPAHSFVDFADLGRGRRDAKSKILRRHAIARGCLYSP